MAINRKYIVDKRYIFIYWQDLLVDLGPGDSACAVDGVIFAKFPFSSASCSDGLAAAVTWEERQTEG